MATPTKVRKKSTSNPARRPAARPGSSGPRRGKNRRRGSVIPWRMLLLTLLLLTSIGALLYLVFLHQPVEPGAVRETPTQGNSAPPTPPYSDQSSKLHEQVKTPPTNAAQAGEKNDSVNSVTDEQEALTSTAAIPTPPPTVPLINIPPPPQPDERPLLALIIDDMGYHPETEFEFLGLNLNLTFSFIPFAPSTAESLAIARRQQRDILLHLPLEAMDPKWNSTPGLLRSKWSEDKIITGFIRALEEVPMAVGVNNHMGSRFTANRKAMTSLLSQFPAYDLFFLDSLTTSESVGAEVAAKQKLPFLARDIFLDNKQEEREIERELEKLLGIAEERGWAVGIGHCYKQTFNVLKKREKELQSRVNLLKLSELVARQNTNSQAKD